MQKKITVAISIIALCVTFFSGTAQAITGITSSITTNMNGTPSLFVNPYEDFSITFTAQNAIGNVTWYFSGSYSSGDVHLSSETGTTTTMYGTLKENSVMGYQSMGYSFALIAYDDGGTNFENVQAGYSFMVLDSAYYGNTPSPIPSPSPITSQDTSTELELATVSTVVLSDEVIAKLAQNVSIDQRELILLTSADFDPSDPPEPTNAMRQRVQSDNGQFMAKLNTINVKRDGWYVFMVTVSDDLVGTKVSDLKLYAAESSDFTASSVGSVSAAFDLLPMANGLTGTLEVSNLFGVKLDTLPKQFLATMFLSASKSITVYIVKLIIMLLTGGCDAGIGIIGGGLMIVAGGAFIAKCIKRKRH